MCLDLKQQQQQIFSFWPQVSFAVEKRKTMVYTTRPTGETLCGQVSSGTLILNPRFWWLLFLKGCGLETYIGHWHANRHINWPKSLCNSIYLHNHSFREPWAPTKNFRGYLYMQRFICTCAFAYVVFSC